MKKEALVSESKNNYLKIALYIIAGIIAVFTGMYFFSNRKNEEPLNSSIDNSRVDIEESITTQAQEPEPIEESAQPETQEQEPIEESAQPETQEQEPVEEETKPDTTEQSPVEEDENNNK